VRSPRDRPSALVLTIESLVDMIPFGEACLCQGELIRCQSDHDDYMCYCRRVAMSDGDGTDSSAQMPIVRCVWASVVMSCHARH
jgi:hypothetical protein